MTTEEAENTATNSQEESVNTEEAQAETVESEEELEVTIGEESPPTESEEEKLTPEWVKETRKANRELNREKRTLEQKLNELQQQLDEVKNGKKQDVLSEKPTLQDCDYDEDMYAAKLLDWNEQKREHDAKMTAQKKAQEDADAAFVQRLSNFQEARAKLKVADSEDAFDVFENVLDNTQRGIIVQGAEKPELLAYALGRNPEKAKALAAIKDPIQYAFAVAKMEAQLKVTPKKAPQPERKVNGSSGVSTDSILDQLREKAERTGDYTEVNAYRRKLRESSK